MATIGPERTFGHENIDLGGRHSRRMHNSNSSGTGKPSRPGGRLCCYSAFLKRGAFRQAGAREPRPRRNHGTRNQYPTQSKSAGGEIRPTFN
jgi:hypothetical protein